MTALAAVAAEGGTWSGAVVEGGRVVFLCTHPHQLPGHAIGCAGAWCQHPAATASVGQTVTRYCPERPDLVLCHDRCPEQVCLLATHEGGQHG